MIEWMKQLKTAFGSSFLFLICLIYFTQGFRSFVWTAVFYQLKDILKLSPSASQFEISVAFFPWSIKPIYEIISDCIPIEGRKRVPYLIISTVLSLVPWIILGLNETLWSSTWHLTILLTVQNLGSAMADVVVDAMIAEAVRLERASFAGDFQSMSWLAMAVGRICGSLLGGYALTNLPIDKMFLLFSVLPVMQFLSCGLVEENSVCGKRLPEVSVVKGYDLVNENGYKTTENRSTGKKSNISTSRRTRRTTKQKQSPLIDHRL